MLLYKYKSLENLWFVLDIVINQRLYCAHWSELNDPLEGRYSVFFRNGDNSPEDGMRAIIENTKETIRISALSKNYKNFLLWSHYANAHKGVAIEIDFPENYEFLHEMGYSPFSPVFVDEVKSDENTSIIFNVKSEEWKYEEEFRILYKGKYCTLPNPVKRIFLGPLVSSEHKEILKRILPSTVELIETEIDYYQGWIREKALTSIWPSVVKE